MSNTIRKKQQLAIMPDNTGEKQVRSPTSGRFEPGTSGNPRGRPRGSRNKLSEAFLDAIMTEWEEYGAEAVRQVREHDPLAFLRIVAVVIRNVQDPHPDPYKNMTTAELNARLRYLLNQCAE